MLKVPRMGDLGGRIQYTIPTSSTTTNVIDIITAGGDDGRAGDVPRRIAGLQDQFDSRRIADRLEEVTLHDALHGRRQRSSTARPMFFLATADAEGRPDVPTRAVSPASCACSTTDTLAFPDYDGNGMFKSLGNMLVNPHVGLLFIDFEHPQPDAGQRAARQ